MAGTGTPDAGAPHPRTPVWPPRRASAPGPAAAPERATDGWPRPRRDPAHRSRRLERLLWLLVAAVALAGVVVIGAIARSGPGSETLQPIAGGSSPEASGVGDDDAPAAPAGERSGAAVAGQPAGWSEAARGFGLAFTRTRVGRDAWFAAMSSWLTPEQAAQYREVPIDDIPAGELLEVDVTAPGAEPHTHGTLTYDTGMVLEVGLSYETSAGGWLVARVSLAD
ncbi:hypothetical protein [Jiangella mangrovi]|uniref:Uncharacterized protein n=1 Tax=Jiangella mangrovi TaxID=1524084 RepID=A0A7W9GPF5_9ACTN|nr:hypothetical protein [Jiangella mangrovi]MBB5787447.1 hypothetical protein [Jiangella mangrovi]